MNTKTFHVGDILTITTGLLVSPTHMEGAYKILDWVTDDTLFTHQLPRASRAAEPYLRKWFPDLAAVDTPVFSEDDAELEVAEWLDKIVAQHGETREVPQIPEGAYTHINPLQELVDIMQDPDRRDNPYKENQ